jgi:hypothetical protein
MPRLEMSGIVLCSGLAGFASSALMLALGLSSMAVRYPLAVLAGYGAFLGLVWAWVAHHRRRVEAGADVLSEVASDGDVPAAAAFDLSDTGPVFDVPDTTPVFQGGGGSFGGGGASGHWDVGPTLDVVDTSAGSAASAAVETASGAADVDPDDGAGAVLSLVVAVAVAAAALIALLFVVWAAPSLLAELLLDALLVSGLYRTLRHVEPRWWLSTALRRTVIPAVVVGATAGFAGWLMQAIEPAASSIGAFVRAMG